MPWVILAIILILIIAVIAMYNKLVNAKMKVDNSWSQSMFNFKEDLI